MITIKEIIQIEITEPNLNHTDRIIKAIEEFKKKVHDFTEYTMTNYRSEGDYCIIQFTKRNDNKEV